MEYQNEGRILESLKNIQNTIKRNHKESNESDNALKETIDKNHKENSEYHKESNHKVRKLEKKQIAQKASDEEKTKWMKLIHKTNNRNLKIIVSVGVVLLASVLTNVWVSINQNAETRVRLDQMEKNISSNDTEMDEIKTYVDGYIN